MRALVLVVALLAGCSHTAWQASAGGPQPPVPPFHGGQVTVTTGYGVATMFGLAVLAAGAYEFSRGGWQDPDLRAVPEMAPARRVNEVDCSKPFDPSLGNIRCK